MLCDETVLFFLTHHGGTDCWRGVPSDACRGVLAACDGLLRRIRAVDGWNDYLRMADTCYTKLKLATASDNFVTGS